jgi:hypothetical protein
MLGRVSSGCAKGSSRSLRSPLSVVPVCRVSAAGNVELRGEGNGETLQDGRALWRDLLRALLAVGTDGTRRPPPRTVRGRLAPYEATLTASLAPALYLPAFALGVRLRIRALELAVTARGPCRTSPAGGRRAVLRIPSTRPTRELATVDAWPCFLKDLVEGHDRRKADDAEWRQLVAPVRTSRSSTF